MELHGEKLKGAIVDLINRKYSRLKLSDEDISEMLFGHACYRRQINEACHELMAEERIAREGEGVASSPFWYRPWTPYIERKF